MRRLVIADIHGCLKTLKELLSKIALNKTDELYFLGDYIDKGKDSAGVIDLIIDLKNEHYQIYPLRGNHEENLLYAYHNYNPRLFSSFVGRINKSMNLLDLEGRLIEKYLDFVEELPYFIELDKFWLVHAGFDTKREKNVFSNFNLMIEIRNFEYDAEVLKNKTVIHGHQVAYLDKIMQRIESGHKIIPLDNGCVYTKPHKIHDYTQLGNLICLNLENYEITIQKNIDVD